MHRQSSVCASPRPEGGRVGGIGEWESGEGEEEGEGGEGEVGVGEGR